MQPSAVLLVFWCLLSGFATFYGIVYSLRTFAIVTAAGLGNLPAVIGVSFVLGWVEQYAGIIMGAEWQIAAAVMVLLGVLVWRQIQLRRQRQVVR